MTTWSSPSRQPNCWLGSANYCDVSVPNHLRPYLCTVTSSSIERGAASRGRGAVDLGPIEYRLLERLLEQPGKVFSREQLLENVWGRDKTAYRRTVDAHI